MYKVYVVAVITYTRDIARPREAHIYTVMYVCNVRTCTSSHHKSTLWAMTAFGAERKKSNLTRGSGGTLKNRARRRLHHRCAHIILTFEMHALTHTHTRARIHTHHHGVFSLRIRADPKGSKGLFEYGLSRSVSPPPSPRRSLAVPAKEGTSAFI